MKIIEIPISENLNFFLKDLKEDKLSLLINNNTKLIEN